MSQGTGEIPHGSGAGPSTGNATVGAGFVNAQNGAPHVFAPPGIDFNSMSPGQSPHASPQASPRASPTPSEAEGPSRRRRREENSNVRPSEGAPQENSNAEDDSNRTLFQQFLQWRSGFFGDGPTSPVGPRNEVKVVLDSKYFQRIKVFDMDRTKYHA